MADFKDHGKVLIMVEKAQDSEMDIREISRECDRFIDLPDGQWDPDIARRMGDRPRMTFDEVSGIVDDIAGDLEETEFAIKISPSSGEASEDTAEIYSGLIREIENRSNAKNVYSSAGRGIVTRGIDGWRVVTKRAQSDSFDQDFFIVPIANYIDRVWFDPASEERDRSDAKWCVVLQSMPVDDYNEMFPKGSSQSVSEGKDRDSLDRDQIESVVVGELLYKVPTRTVLIKMSSGAVYTEENLKPVKDELKAAGVTEVDRRTSNIDVVHSRKFDGGKWLEEEKETVFEWLPVIPAYSLFKIVDNRVIWRGDVEKKMDAQRSLNYGESRKLEEGALSPRAKYWMTETQALGHEDTLETMNTNADPVQFYNPDAETQQAPFMQGGAVINPGLVETTATARAYLRSGSGQVDPAASGGMFQSGEAQRRLQNKAQGGLIKYSKGLEIAICHTAKILMNAIPKLIDTPREMRILSEDRKTAKQVTLNEQVFDEQTQKLVTLNDLTKGVYDATCSVGPAFKNRQEETVQALLEFIRIIPEMGALGADIIAGNINAPGMDAMHGRLRQMAIQKGVVPDNELSDEEKQELQAAQQAAAQQPQEPTPEEKIGQAELQKAEADVADTQSIIEDRNKRFELDLEKTKINAEDADQKHQLEMRKLELQENTNQTKAEQTEDVNAMKADQQRFDQQQTQIDLLMKELKNNADVLKTLREAMGVDSIVGPHNTEAYIQQAEIVTNTQEEIAPNLETRGIAVETDQENLSDTDV